MNQSEIVKFHDRKEYGENEVRRHSRKIKEADQSNYLHPDIEDKNWYCKNYQSVVTEAKNPDTKFEVKSTTAGDDQDTL